MSEEMRAALETLAARNARDLEVYKADHHYGIMCSEVCITHDYRYPAVHFAIMNARQIGRSRRYAR